MTDKDDMGPTKLMFGICLLAIAIYGLTVPWLAWYAAILVVIDLIFVGSVAAKMIQKS